MDAFAEKCISNTNLIFRRLASLSAMKTTLRAQGWCISDEGLAMLQEQLGPEATIDDIVAAALDASSIQSTRLFMDTRSLNTTLYSLIYVKSAVNHLVSRATLN